ncbi:MAG: NAD(P)-dependent oxidoreductase [Bacteroidia bacterium]
MKKILITGATGFIGGFLVEEALKKNYEVYASVRKSSNTQYLHDKRIKLIELDFSNPVSLNQKMSEASRFDIVIHNAGLTKAKTRTDYSLVNYHYSKNLIDTLIHLNKIPEKFIYMSSLSAFGPGNPTSLSVVKTTDTPYPITSYGKSKLETEKYLSGLQEFPFIIIRPTAVYGPRDKDMLTIFKLINKNIEMLIGFKKQYFTFIYVKDLINVVFQLIESNIKNKSYFISDGSFYDGSVLGNIIKTQLKKKTIKMRLPVSIVKPLAFLSESTKFITGFTPIFNLEKVNELESINWKCDIQPLIDDIHFKADYNLENGIRETIEWYKKEKWL